MPKFEPTTILDISTLPYDAKHVLAHKALLHQTDEVRSRRGSGWNWVGVVSGLFNPNDSGVGALERRPRHDKGYHEGGGCRRRGFAFR